MLYTFLKYYSIIVIIIQIIGISMNIINKEESSDRKSAFIAGIMEIPILIYLLNK